VDDERKRIASGKSMLLGGMTALLQNRAQQSAESIAEKTGGQPGGGAPPGRSPPSQSAA